MRSRTPIFGNSSSSSTRCIIHFFFEKFSNLPKLFRAPKSQTFVLFLNSFQGCHLFLTWPIKTFSMIWVFAKIGAWGDVSARCAKPMKPIRLQITQLILTISFLDSFSKPTNLIFSSKYIFSKSLIFPLYYPWKSCQRSMTIPPNHTSSSNFISSQSSVHPFHQNIHGRLMILIYKFNLKFFTFQIII